MLQTDTVAAIQATAIREWADLFNWPALTATGLRVAGALVVAVIANYALKAVLRSVERSSEKDGIVTAQEQRTRTLLSLLRSMGRVVIWVMTLFMVLGALGLQLGPLLAGAGVVGLAVSFGAQSLVKDVISGLFILMENQFGVGDVVRLEGVSGSVERMTLRVVVLRDVHGVVHVVPNGEIKKVSNLTRGWARVVLDVAVAYKEDPDAVMAVMLDEGRRLYEDPQWRPLLLDEVQVPGIESFGEHGVTIRILAKTLPLKQWDVARELRRRLKHRFDQEKIEVPFPSQTMYWGEGQSPAELATLAGAPARPTAGAADAES
ncbi:MAG TPA: mechanosensitive ion channel family protein [Longimicrobium sp.]|nr:mechanosensitive ion channel family protein [Longimicrobium sp.]